MKLAVALLLTVLGAAAAKPKPHTPPPGRGRPGCEIVDVPLEFGFPNPCDATGTDQVLCQGFYTIQRCTSGPVVTERATGPVDATCTSTYANYYITRIISDARLINFSTQSFNFEMDLAVVGSTRPAIIATVTGKNGNPFQTDIRCAAP